MHPVSAFDRRYRKGAVSVLTALAVVASACPVLPALASQRTADSLLGYWKFDETSGTSAADSSGGGITGTHQNSPTISSDVPSVSFTDARSLSFDGADDYVSASAVRTNGNAAFTYSFWAKTSDSTNAHRTMLAEGRSSSDTPTFHVQLTSDGDTDCTTDDTYKIYMSDDAATVATLCSVSTHNDGSWHHLALIQTGSSNRTFYVDGVSVDNDTTTLGTTTFDKISIGALSRTTTGQYFPGLIDDVRIYARAIAPWELSELAAGRHIPAYWRGKSGTAFERRQSWSGSYVPDPYSRIVVRAATGSLTLTGAIKYAGLTIATGAVLKLNGTGTTMNDDGTFTNHGTLALRNTETLTDFTNDISRGTILLVGSGSTTGFKTGNSYNNLTINDGLVAYWKLDETSGANAADSSGYNHSGALINGPTPSASVPSVRFHNPRSLPLVRASSQYVQTSFTGHQRSVSLWFKVTNVAGHHNILYTRNTDDDRILSIHIRQTSEGGDLGVYPTCTDTVGFTGWQPGLNTWYHVAVVSGVGTYVDGRLVQSCTAALPVTANPAILGRNPQANYAGYLAGSLDDVRVYDRALMPAEVSALAAGNQPSLQKGSVTLSTSLDVDGTLTLNGGLLDVSSSNRAVSIGGSFLNNGGVFAARKGTVTFDGTSAGLQILSGGTRFNDATFSGVGATWNTRDRFTVSGSLVVNDGTIDNSGSYVTSIGDWTQNGGSFTPRSGTVVLTSPSDSTLIPPSAFSTLQIEDATENGLIGYWKFDEGTNSGSIIDSSPYGNTGVRRGTGGLVWTGSTLPSLSFDNPFAMKFNGLSDAVIVPDTSALTPSAITVSAWIRPSSLPGTNITYAIVDKRDDVGGTAGYLLELANSGGTQFLAWYSKNQYNAYPTSLSTTAWTHVAVTQQGTNSVLYINGAAVSSATDTDALTNYATTFKIGAGNGYFPGHIDDVRVYARALSAPEIRNLYGGSYADGDNGTADVFLAGNLDLSAMTIVSGTLTAGSRTIDVSGDWNNYAGSGAFVAGTSTVDLDGAVTQNVRGSTAFSTFEISTSAAQTVKFGSGTTQYVAANLVLQGAASNLLTLSPLAAGYRWYLDLGDSASQTIDYVSPSYSVASGGLVILANDGTSTDGGNNANWLFVTPEVTFQSGALTLAETAGTATLVITRSGSALPAVTIPYSYGGTATGTGTDYTLVTPSPIVMAAGETSTGILVSLIDDSSAESDETITLTLGSPTNGVVGTTGSLVITLTSDDIASSGGGAQQEESGGSGGGGGGRRGSSTQMSGRIAAARAAIAGRFDQMRASAQQPQTVPARTVARREQASASAASVPPDPRAYPYVTASRQHVALVLAANRSVVYNDVPMDAWFAPYVAQLVENDVARGYTDAQGALKGQFGVSDPVTYAEMLKMALEAAGKADDLPTLAPANRSARGTWAATYMRRAEDLDLSVFRKNPDMNAPATRGEVVQTLLEVLGFPIGNTASVFTDVPAGHPHGAAIALASFHGFVEGDRGPDGAALNTFRPDNPINRAEVAKIIALAREIAQ